MNTRFLLIFLFMALFPFQSEGQVVIADAVKFTHIDGPEIAEVIVDNSSPGFSLIEGWSEGNFPGGHLDNYLFTLSSGSRLIVGYWAANIPIPGTYEVSLWYPAGSNRSPETHYRILHAEGISEATVDQTTGGDWTKIGNFQFEDRGVIQISNRTGEGIVEDIIVDNGETLFSTLGYWHPGTYSPSYREDYIFTGCARPSSATVSWEIPVMVPGNYEVYAWFYPGGNRSEQAHYTIPYASGQREVWLNQNPLNEGWHSLGTYPFKTGIHSVTLDNRGDSEKVILADGLWFEYMENQGPLPPTINLVADSVPMPASGEPVWIQTETWSLSPVTSVTAEQYSEEGRMAIVDLFDDGNHQDGVSGDGIYGGALPGGDAATMFEYQVFAGNEVGGTGMSDRLKYLVAYEEAATPELRFTFTSDWQTEEQTAALLERIRGGNMNGILFGVRSSDGAYYQTRYGPVHPDVPEGYDPLQAIIEQAHDTSEGKARIQIHPYVMVYWFFGDTPPPGHILDEHPEWISETYESGQEVPHRLYLDQGIPEVQDYQIDVFMEIVSNYNIDGFNLDTIRYARQQYGYNPIALDYFHQFTGRSDRPAIDDPEWSAWRREMVTSFVRRIYANILKVRPDLFLSMDGVTWEQSKENKEENIFWYGVFQDWPGWLENHYIDSVLGMAYREEIKPSLAQEFDDWLAFLQGAQGDRVATAIVGAYKNPVQHTLVQLHRIRQSGSPIQCIYIESNPSSEGTSVEAFYDALRNQVYPTAVSVPDWPWKSNPTTGVLMGKVYIGGTPSRRTRVTLGQRETRTDLCGFYVFFDVAPDQEHELAFYDDETQRLRETLVSVGAGEVIEENVPASLNVPKGLWLIH